MYLYRLNSLLPDVSLVNLAKLEELSFIGIFLELEDLGKL